MEKVRVDIVVWNRTVSVEAYYVPGKLLLNIPLRHESIVLSVSGPLSSCDCIYVLMLFRCVHEVAKSDY
jgi:hypothetical protein